MTDDGFQARRFQARRAAFLAEHDMTVQEERDRHRAGNAATFDVSPDGTVTIKRPGRAHPYAATMFATYPLTADQRMHLRIMRDMNLNVGDARRLGLNLPNL